MMDASGGNAKAPVLSLKDVTRSYRSGERELNVLRGIDLELRPGEMTGLIGPSGSGKSTLLHVAGLLEKPDSGHVFTNGKDDKRVLADNMAAMLAPIRERAGELASHPGRVDEVLAAGAAKARAVARATLAEVRDAMGFLPPKERAT